MKKAEVRTLNSRFLLTSSFCRHPLRKAGRYKLAAPVSKTGSDHRSREHYPGLPPAFASHVLDGEGCPPKLERRWAMPFICRLRPAGQFNHQPRGTHHDNHSSIRAEVATREAAKAYQAETKSRKQEGPTGPPNAAEPNAPGDLLAGRQSCRIPSAVEDVIRGSGGCKKGSANETGHPLPKQVALTEEL